MNIEFANTIPLSEILIKIGFKPLKKRGDEQLYLSPLRNEKTPSFSVNDKLNRWFDFGEDAGGDVVAFISAYLKSTGVSHNVSDALRWLKNMMGYATFIQPVPVANYTKEDSVLKFKSAKTLQHTLLIEYLAERGIPLDIAAEYLKEVAVFNGNSGKTFNALGLKNEDSGWELRSQFFKGTIRPKTITFIRGTTPKPDGINIFEGFIDYLSIITQREGKAFSDDTIILNSLSCMKDASAYIKGYGYKTAFTWLDNDDAGEKSKASFDEFFKMEEGLQHQPMNKLYAGHKDVNDWHVATFKPTA
jgi:hypothetical protein